MQYSTGTAPRAVDTTLPTIENTKRSIDAYLSALFEQRIAQANVMSGDYAALWQSIARLSGAGGKRLRPYILLLSYSIHKPGQDVSIVLPAAAAQELLHLAMLIHDDIIDRDQVRYGVKNVNGQYNDLYQPYIKDQSELQHFSNSAAIMAGDLLIAEAYRAVQQCDTDAANIATAQAALSGAIFSVVGGELLDAESTFRHPDEIDTLAIAREKTASYSFVGPLVAGAALAGAPQSVISQLTSFGMALGVAFQLQDDLLSVFGNERITGKSASGDLTEGKYTYLVETFYKRASSQQREQFDAVFKHQQASADDIEIARELLATSGARHAVEQKIEVMAAEAAQYLAAIQMNDSSRAAFAALIELCIRRVK